MNIIRKHSLSKAIMLAAVVLFVSCFLCVKPVHASKKIDIQLDDKKVHFITGEANCNDNDYITCKIKAKGKKKYKWKSSNTSVLAVKKSKRKNVDIYYKNEGSAVLTLTVQCKGKKYTEKVYVSVYKRRDKKALGIIKKKNIPLYSGKTWKKYEINPRKESLEKGLCVYIMGSCKNYYYVSTPVGRGYVRKETLNIPSTKVKVRNVPTSIDINTKGKFDVKLEPDISTDTYTIYSSSSELSISGNQYTAMDSGEANVTVQTSSGATRSFSIVITDKDTLHDIKTSSKEKSIQINWNTDNSYTNAVIYRATKDSGPYKYVHECSYKSGEYVDTEVETEFDYFYKVYFKKSNGTYVASNQSHARAYHIDKQSNIEYFEKEYPFVYIKGKEYASFNENKYVPVRFLFDGETLEMHVNLVFYIDKNIVYSRTLYNISDQPYSNLPHASCFTNVSETGEKENLIDAFEEGLKKCFDNKVVIGSDYDFERHSFKTKIIINEFDYKTVPLEQHQKYLKNSYLINIGTSDCLMGNTYWFFASDLGGTRVYMPTNEQLKLNTTDKVGYVFSKSLFEAAAAHEFCHLLYLDDAYYNESAFVKNLETCEITYSNNKRIYHNIMYYPYNFQIVIANDMEMILKGFSENKGQSYMNYNKSDVIKTPAYYFGD